MLTWRRISHIRGVDFEPEFYDDLIELLEESPFSWFITRGRATWQEQSALYNYYLLHGSPKAAPPGKSAHNYGLAVDLVLDVDPQTPGLQPSWNIKLAAWVWLFVKLKFHPRLKSGVSFDDADHIEKYKWENYKGWDKNVGTITNK